MKKKIIVLSVILCAAAAMGTQYLSRDTVETDNAYVKSEITAVSAEVSGKIVKVFANDNQWVRKGDPLFSIDAEDYEANQQIAQAAVDVAKAALASNTARLSMQSSKIQQAEQAIVSARANASHQHAELKRLKKLLAQQSVSKTRYEQQETATINADAQLKRANLMLDAEQKNHDALIAEHQKLAAQIQQAEAKRNLADIALERTTVYVPFDGYVANRNVQVGKLVQPGMGLMTLVPSTVWVEANFKETQLENVTQGQRVDIRLDMFPDRVLTGKVASITHATGAQFSLLPAQNATGNFVKVVQRVPVRIELNIPEELKTRIYTGLSAEVVINTGA
ncbi:MAG: HlyD family secretion protein [Shewanella sp.]|nr:HlyD family secretion protein [Shewanella sp.]MCF1456273.1 HlyD family secretion protein [Shewanella sp.]